MATFRLSKWASKRDGLLPMAKCVKEKERAQWQGNTHFYIDSECATVCVCIGNPFVCPRERENSSAVSCSLIARPTGSPKETRSLHLVCVRLYACAAWASPFQSERARKTCYYILVLNANRRFQTNRNYITRSWEQPNNFLIENFLLRQ